MRRRFTKEPHVPKYQQVLEKLSEEILTGRYTVGQKFPSEAALVQQFQTSRITIGRALRDLTRRGLVERIAGSGTYVKRIPAEDGRSLFGLLIPDLGRTEIFDPICRGIATAPQVSQHALLWGHSASDEATPEQRALELCEQFVQRHVSGVFFAPLELSDAAREANLSIVARLEAARIPIVLLDRCVLPYPERSAHDLVGIDNRRAGYMATEYLLRSGTARVHFLARAGAAPTVSARIAGYQEAVQTAGEAVYGYRVHRVAAVDEATIRPLLASAREGDGFVCANDRTAGELMRIALAAGYRIPRDIRIVGIDDVEYASLLPVPLTTVRQPCREIGEAALAAMLARIERPQMAVRDILVQCRLVVRESAG